MIAKVVLNTYSLSTDRYFDYLIPINLENVLDVGMRVKVPFGRGNKTYEGYVMYIVQESSYSNLKSIIEIIGSFSYFSNKDVGLIEFIKHRYFCTYSSAVKLFLPSGLNFKLTKHISLTDMPFEQAKKLCSRSIVYERIINLLNVNTTMTEDELKIETGKNNIIQSLYKLEAKGVINITERFNESISDKKRTYVKLNIEIHEASLLIDTIEKKAPARARVLEVMCDCNEILLSELLLYADVSKKIVDVLVEKEILVYREEIYHESSVNANLLYAKGKPVLTKYQTDALTKISENLDSKVNSTYLLHGVTGSGKTEVYLSLIEKALEYGLDSILLVPEITLTTQMISQIYNRFGDNVALLHSRLSSRQRFDQWNNIKNGKCKIAVGARSAIFAPFSNLGLIIVDEEHENTYKSEMSPRYDAIEIARYLSKRDGLTLVLASATPRIEDYYKATQGVYNLVEIPERIGKNMLPKVEISDMRIELENGNTSIFSEKLKEYINESLSNKEQIILFLNRRGFSSFVSCRSCGYVEKCPNCSVSLTYHKAIDSMLCHYCDYKTKVKNICPKCSSKHIKSFGIGTEKVVSEINALFPHAKTLRMDADTTIGQSGHENILNQFKNKEADILVGTQMITKGLDFENVTLVGVIAADMSLNVDDYTACERTFDLITQVVGRAGRAQKNGRAVIQTYNPDDETILLSSKQDYKSFYDEEISLRSVLLYPPFKEFIKIQFSGKNKYKVKDIASKFYNDIKKSNPKDVELYNMGESPLFILNGNFRYRFMLKAAYKKDLYNFLHMLNDKYKNNKDNVSIIIDVNPVSTY